MGAYLFINNMLYKQLDKFTLSHIQNPHEVNPNCFANVDLNNCYIALSKGVHYFNNILNVDFGWGHNSLYYEEPTINIEDIALILHTKEEVIKSEHAELILLTRNKKLNINKEPFSWIPYNEKAYRTSLSYISVVEPLNRTVGNNSKDIVRIVNTVDILGF